MPDAPNEKPPERSMRMQRREARMKLVRDSRTPSKIRVSPAKEEFRRLLKHPNGGGFRSAGSVEWPHDSFTKRRIRDGDVIVEKREQNKPVAAKAAAPSRGPASPPRGGESPL